MKDIKTCIIATIVTAIIICSCAYTIPSQAEAGCPKFYHKLTIVFKTEKVGDYWVIYCMDKSRNIWTFYDESMWIKGDIVNLLMWATRENEEEDEIIEVYWEGYTENISLFFK